MLMVYFGYAQYKLLYSKNICYSAKQRSQSVSQIGFVTIIKLNFVKLAFGYY